jgi:hypothetical protein
VPPEMRLVVPPFYILEPMHDERRSARFARATEKIILLRRRLWIARNILAGRTSSIRSRDSFSFEAGRIPPIRTLFQGRKV